MKTTLETSGKDVKTTLETSGELSLVHWEHIELICHIFAFRF